MSVPYYRSACLASSGHNAANEMVEQELHVDPELFAIAMDSGLEACSASHAEECAFMRRSER